MAKECFEKAGDVSALLLLYLATGDRDGLENLSKTAGKSLNHPNNLKGYLLTNPDSQSPAVRTMSHLQVSYSWEMLMLVWTSSLVRIEPQKLPCLLVLMRPGRQNFYSTNNRISTLNACSLANKATTAWRADLESKQRGKLAATIADPHQNPELFEEDWEASIAREAELRGDAGSLDGSDEAE